MMHGLKATSTLLFLVTLRQPEACNVANSFRQHLERVFQEMRIKPKERHITKFYSVVLKQLLAVLDNAAYHEGSEKALRQDITRCYNGVDMTESAKMGNVFFPKASRRPKCSFWVYYQQSKGSKKAPTSAMWFDDSGLRNVDDSINSHVRSISTSNDSAEGNVDRKSDVDDLIIF